MTERRSARASRRDWRTSSRTSTSSRRPIPWASGSSWSRKSCSSAELFAAYAIYRWLYFAAFEGGSHILDIRLGAANTIVLLGSSLTMALSVRSAQTGNRRALIGFLIATMIPGSDLSGRKSLRIQPEIRGARCSQPGLGARRRCPGEARARRPGSCANLFLFLFRHDRIARHPHDHRHGPVASGWCYARARTISRHIISRRSKWWACTGTSSISSGFFCFRCST